jgi:hypothetical protein
MTEQKMTEVEIDDELVHEAIERGLLIEGEGGMFVLTEKGEKGLRAEVDKQTKRRESVQPKEGQHRVRKL